MAVMIPKEPCKDATNGEIKVFHLLNNLLDDDHIVLSELKVKDRKSDFVVVGPELGILVLEVKDWSIDNIQKINKKIVTFKNGDEKLNPFDQARGYKNKILNQMKANLEGYCLGDNKFLFLCNHAVVFTNISTAQFNRLSKDNKKSAIEEIINEKYVLFKDQIKGINTTNDLVTKLKSMRMLKFNKVKLEKSVIEDICKILYPEIIIPEHKSESEQLRYEKEQLEIVKKKRIAIEEQIKENMSKFHLDKERIIRERKQLENDKIQFGKDKQTIEEEYKKLKKSLLVKHRRKHILSKVFTLLVAVIVTFASFRTGVAIGERDIVESDKVSIAQEEIPMMKFIVEDVGKNKGTWIEIHGSEDDDKKNKIAKVFRQGSEITFYRDKKIIIRYGDGKVEEYYYENNILSIEVANSYTTIYHEDTKYNNKGRFKYDFTNNEIVD